MAFGVDSQGTMLHETLLHKLKHRAAALGLSPEALLEQWLDHPLNTLPAPSPYLHLLNAANVGVLVADAQQPDFPIIYVNAYFEAITGYTAAEAIGRNCRFLQGDDTDQPGLEVIRAALTAGRACVATVRNYRQDGSRFWNELHLSPVRDNHGTLTHFIGIQKDVTDRIRAERERDDLRFRFQTISEMISDYALSLTVDEAGRLAYEWTTDTFERLTGFAPHELDINDAAALRQGLSADNFERLTQMLQCLITTPCVLTENIEFNRREGGTGHVQIYARSLADTTGRVQRIIAAIQDISEKVTAERQLAEMLERFQMVSEMTSDYAFALRVEPDGSLTREWMTHSYERVTGYKIGELDDRGGWAALTHPDDLPVLLGLLKELLITPHDVITQYRLITKSGEVRHVRGYNRSIADDTGRIVRIIGAQQDITERVVVEKQLAELLLRFQTISELLSDHAYSIYIKPDGRMQREWVTQSYEALTGYTLHELDQENRWEDVVHPEDRPRFDAMMAKLRQHPTNVTAEYRIVKKNGEIGYEMVYSRSLADETGRVVRIIGAGHDITVERLMDETLHDMYQKLAADFDARNLELAQSEARLRLIMENSSDLVILSDATGVIQYINPACREIGGYEPEELIGRRPRDFFHPDEDAANLQRNEAAVQKALTVTDPALRYQHHVARFRRKDGEYVWLESHTQIILESDTILNWVSVARDITKRKQLEDQIEQMIAEQQQLLNMKTLFLRTVSHEFPTPLTALNFKIESLRRRYNDLTPDQREANWDKINQLTKQLYLLVQDVSAFNKTNATGIELNLENVDLHALIQMCVDQVHDAFGTEVPIGLMWDTPPTLIRADARLLQRIIVNLLSNAVKYSKRRGTVQLRVRINDGLHLFVKDQGIGIPLEDQDHIFEPFRRASNVGVISGTGLGLALVRQVVDALGGNISFTSMPDEGTTFQVRLPLSASIEVFMG